MATVLKCKTCQKFKPFTDYDGSEWQKNRKKRQCKECKPSKKTQTVAAATCRNKEQTTTAASGIPNTHTRTHTHARFLSLSFTGRDIPGRPALGVGRPCSDLVGNHVVRTVSKVLCLRSLRTSRCCWAYTSFQTDSRLFRLTQTRISRCLAKLAAARAAPLVLSRPPQLRRVPAPALSHSSTSPRLYVHPLLVGRE